MLNYFGIIGLVNGLTSTSLGYFVYTRSKRDIRCITYGLLCLSVSVWSYFYFLWQIAQTENIALYCARAFMAGAIFIPVTYLHYILALVSEHKKKRAILVLGYAAAVAFLISDFTPLFVKDVTPKFSFQHWPNPGPLFHFYLFIMFFSYAAYGIYILGKNYRYSSGITRNQMLYVLLATIIGYVGGATNFPLWYDIPIYPVGNILVSACVAIFAYAIVKYRLMDISVVINKGLAYGLLIGLIFVPTYLGIIISQRATFYSIPPLLAGTLIFACGLWIALKNPKSVTNISFSLVCLGVCIWLFSSFMIYSTTHEEEALFWEKFAYMGVVGIPAFFYHFCESFLQRKANKKLILANYLISALFLSLIPTHYLLNGQYSYFWGYYAKAYVLQPLFLVYFASVSVFSLRKLYLGYKAKEETAPLEAARIKYIFWTSVIGYLASINFIQEYGFEFYPIGYLFVTLWTIGVTYAIAKYQVMDISLIITRAKVLRYGQVLALIPIYLLVLGLIRVFTGSMQYLLAGILVAAFLIGAGLIANLQKRMESAIGKVLFPKRFDVYQTLQEFSTAMVTILDLETLQEKIIGTLSCVMGIAKASLFLLDKEKDTYFLVAAHEVNDEQIRRVKIRTQDPLPQYLRKTDQPIMKEELEHHISDLPRKEAKSIVDTMALIESELCISLINKDHLIGFLNLGHKTNREMYSQEDLNLLSTLAQNAAIALDNALLYEDFKRQQSLMRRTDRLRSLETMAGGFAHEIRNPLTSIKTFIQLAIERKDDPEFMGAFSKMASEDMLRIERLIQEILGYARYMEPQFTEEDLNEVVESSLYFVGVKADEKEIRIGKDLAGNLPTVLVDRQQIKQVLLNLYLNAMQAMPDGGRLTVRTHALSKGNPDPWVQIEIGDTGHGIQDADLEHIFDPFFTTKHESEEREGTGLGLTIVHEIVQEHRGHIEVESKPGVGTTFYVSLPANPALHERRKQMKVT